MNKKIKIVLLGLVLIATAITSCKKALESITFSKEYSDLTFVIDTTSFVGEMTLGENVVNTDITKRLEESGFTAVNVKDVKLRSVKIECLTPEQNFNFIRRASLLISGEFENALIIAEKELPEVHSLTEISFDLNNLNLNDFFKSESFSFRVMALTDLPIEISTTVRVSARFEIKAGI